MSVRIIERLPDGREIHTPAVYVSAEELFGSGRKHGPHAQRVRYWEERRQEARDEADARQSG